MAEAVWFTPRIPRAVLKALMQRRDGPGLAHFGLWLALLGGSGAVAALAWGSWWAVPAFFVYGTIYSSSDARWHECQHGTPFRTRWLNEAFYHLSSFMTLREAIYWRWSHTRHHTHTILTGRDPEIQVPRPPNLAAVAADFFYLVGGWAELKRLVLHSLGHRTPGARDFVPPGEFWKVALSSRIYLGIIGGTAGLSVALGSFLPMMFVALPRFYCGWLHELCALTQHAGLAENVADHRLNTRTVMMNPVFRWLYFNMSYHLEHHLFPTVPFHALARLHAAIKDQLPPPYPSLLAAYREIVPTLLRQVHDPSYCAVRPLPVAA